MHKFTKIVVRNSVVGIAAQLSIKVLSFCFSLFVLRKLGPEISGQYAAVIAFGSLFIFLGDLGLSPYSVREFARWREHPDGPQQISTHFGNLLALRLLLSLLASVLQVVTAYLTGWSLLLVGAIALNGLGLVIYSIYGASDAVLAGYERLDLGSGPKVAYQILLIMGGAVALALGGGYYGLILATLLAISVMTYLCWRRVRALGVRPGRITPGRWRGLLKASLPFGIIGFTLGLSYKFDSVLLKMFRGDLEIGYYNAAYSLVFSIVMFSNVLNTSLYPSLARQSASDPGSLATIYDRALRYLMVLAIPIAVGTAALADQIVPFLFSSAYLPAIPALQIVIWVVPLMFASEFLGYVVLIGGKERSVARSVICSTALNVLCNIALVPRYGLLAAAAMTVVTEAVLVGQYLWLLRELLRKLPWGRILGLPALSAAAMGAVVLMFKPYLPLLLNVAVGAGIYLGLLLVFGVVGRAEVQFVRAMRGRVEAEGV